MKNIYIFEYTYNDIDVSIDNMSGTQFRNNLIIDYYRNICNVTYCSNYNIIDSNKRYDNVNFKPNLNYEHGNELVNLLREEKIDLIISTSTHLDNLMIEFYCNHIANKYLFIDNFWPYDINVPVLMDIEGKYIFNKIYDNIIVVNNFDFTPDKSKYINIQNPFWPNKEFYEDLELKEKNKSIIFTFSPMRTDFVFFLEKVYPLLHERIPDLKYKFCTPNYGKFDDYKDILKDKINNDENFIFLGSLSQEELKEELLKTPCSYRLYGYNESCGTGIYTELLCYCLPISDFKDGMKFNCSPDFYEKYKISDKENVEEIVNRIVDVVENYDFYKDILINEHDYILNNFSPDKKLEEYKKVIDNLLED